MKDTSAERVAVATEKTEESADRHTVLAANRTVFAAERIYAAWVRTGLAALASGVGAKAALAVRLTVCARRAARARSTRHLLYAVGIEAMRAR